MTEKGIERRLCQRFKIPGATIAYKIQKFFSSPLGFQEEFCPILDISRGGVRFLSQNSPKFNSRIYLQISIPGERIPLNLKGRVRWSSFNPGKSYKYQTGVQFNPYGEEKNQNYPGALVKIIALEQKFIEPGNGDAGPQTSEFSI